MVLADELQAVSRAQDALAKSDPRDCDEIPGFLTGEARLNAIVAELYDIRAQSLIGVAALARVLQVSFVKDDYQAQGDLAWNLADDILRLQATGALNG